MTSCFMQEEGEIAPITFSADFKNIAKFLHDFVTRY